MKNWILITLVAALVAGVLAGCGNGGGGASLSGTVIDGGTDKPLAGVRVALRTASATTGTNGAFILTNLTLGSGVLTAQLANYEITSMPVTITAGQNVLPEPVRMAPSSGNPPGEPPRTIQGTITLTGESNASGVVVSLFAGATQYDQMTTTNDGKYFFWAPTGTYKVRAEKTGFVTQEQQVTVSDLTKVVTVNITLAR